MFRHANVFSSFIRYLFIKFTKLKLSKKLHSFSNSFPNITFTIKKTKIQRKIIRLALLHTKTSKKGVYCFFQFPW